MSSSEVEQKESLSPAVNSAAAVLNVLADEGTALPAAVIARRIGRAKSTVANILAALHESGLLERDSRGRHQLGRKVVELGGPYLAENDWISDFHQMSGLLPAIQHETVSLASLNDHEIIYLAHHDGNQPVRWVANVGARLPTAATALGIAMLGTLEAGERQSVLETITEYPALTEYSYRSEAELIEAVEVSEEQGFAVGDQLNTLGLCSISMPLRHTGSGVYALGITLLSSRLTPELQSDLLQDLEHLARRLLPPLSERS